MRTVLGLDVGSHSVKAVELQQTLRGVGPSQVQAILRGDEPLPELIRELVQRRGLATDSVVIAIRGDRVSVRRLEFPFAEKRRVAQAVPFEIEDQLPFDLDDVVIDWEIVSRERSRSRVLAAVVPRHHVSEGLELLREANCDPRIVECEGLVLANLTAAFDLPGARILVDIGHSKTTFCAMFHGQPVSSRAIRTGGLALTRALAEDRGLELGEAERIKCEEGVVDPSLGTPLPQVGRVLDRIAGEILRLVSSIEPTLGSEVPEVTLMGGSAQLEQIDALLAERCDLDVRRLGLPREETGIGLVAGGPPIVYAPAIALALRGTSRATTHFNFRQDEFSKPLDLSRYRRDFGTTGLLAVGVTLLAVLGFGSDTYLESRRAGSIEDQIAKLHERAMPGEPIPSNALASLRNAVEDSEDRASFLGVYRGNLSALDVLIEISLRVPTNLDVVFDELSIDRQTVRIRVYAQSFEAAERLGAELAKFGPFKNSRIGDITTDKKTGRKKFDVIISLTEDA